MTSTITRPPAPSRPDVAAPPAWRQRLSRWDLKASPYLYIAPFFVMFGLLGLFPLLYTFNVALHDWDLLRGQGDFVGLDNFVAVLGDRLFWNSVTNTLSIFVISVIPQLLVALVVAALLDQHLKASTFWRISVILPYVVSPVAVTLIFSSVFNPGDGLANNLLNVIGIDDIAWKQDTLASHVAIATMVNWRWTGYNTLIFLAAMQAVPRELHESAAVDGAGAIRRFFSITIPGIRPTFIFVVLTATIGTLQLFAEPRLFDVSNAGGIGGAQRQFQTTVLFLWEVAFFRRDFGQGAAVAWLLFLLIVIFALANFLLSRRVASTDSPAISKRALARLNRQERKR